MRRRVSRRGVTRTLAIVILVCPLLVAGSVLQPVPEAASGTAFYSHGILHLALPYQGKQAGTGRLLVEVLDPEDRVLGRGDLAVEAAAGPSRWKADIRMEKPLPVDELVWD